MRLIFQKTGIVVLMLLSLLPVYAYDFESDGIAYTITSLTDLTVSVDQLLNKEATLVNIPENVEYKGKLLTVTGIEAKACSNITTLSEVVMPNTIVYIGDYAFMNCSSLIKINMPQSIRSIGTEAFSGCSSMRAFTIPNGIKEINTKIFYGCSSLTSVILPNDIQSIGDYAFAYSGIQKIDIPLNVTTLGEGAFSSTQIKTIDLPMGIEKVPAYCFMNCPKLTDIYFSSAYIGASAFANCIALQEISLPPNLISIGDNAFKGCELLKKFVIPSAVTEIEPNILWECPNIETLQIGSGLKGLPVHAYHNYKKPISYRYYSIGSYYYYKAYEAVLYPEIKKNIPYLEGIRRLIIDDAQETFSIKGFNLNGNVTTPAFANLTLDYFYVGRPLIDIKKWSSNVGSTGFTVTEIQQGFGRIKKLEVAGYCESVPFFYQKIDSLRLGENINSINLQNIYTDSLKQIECLSKIPPQIKGTFPTSVFTDATLYVPYGCKDLYATSDIWKNFWNIKEFESDTESEVESVIVGNNPDELFRIYNLNGALIKETRDISDFKSLPSGLYIVNGKKFVIK